MAINSFSHTQPISPLSFITTLCYKSSIHLPRIWQNIEEQVQLKALEEEVSVHME